MNSVPNKVFDLISKPRKKESINKETSLNVFL